MNAKRILYKYGYILCITFFVIGLRLALSWSYNNRLFGVVLVLASAMLAYFIYIKTSNVQIEKTDIDLFQLFMGFSLIILVVIYNLLASDKIGSFDIGMMIAGLAIILLNTRFSSFLKLTKKNISFISFFLFITMLLYGFLFSGLPFLLGDKANNYLFGYITQLVAYFSSVVLNMIQPTSYSGNTVDFNGFRVYIGDACSGVESISIFFSSVIAYLISIRSREYKKMIVYLLVGTVILSLLNVLRVVSIVLAGYYIGMDAFYLMHLHLGWIFFVIGFAIFWYILINNFKSEESSS
ncbi:archaeosortase/exosortase family protein [Methanolobus sp. WCC5]|uniref:archaeosortase/exosortase family protein n=1 Tax=Methanolobus sp. WCC5 TaxID=3125785 RepID=UPI00324909E4